ncbi:MAG: bifunctional phosphoribosyl-AMP cyclohydrolase/phosphoribosyl-ATP diphosphatase HisIE, partial [Clostridia bacterium]|nr:bifunctional phosphoribosyl-AMP cyclohydrolase/phosphoribosyl-ATP diphosphatase HisIE [Clostridia bacterium]
MEEIDVINLKYDDNGLIPAIIQDYQTKEVLMMAYMNKASLEKTIETKKTWFYSRSRQKLWNKGETSGHFQDVKRISYDCDEDTLLIEVIQTGSACHTGSKSCFYRNLLDPDQVLNEAIVYEVANIIRERKENPKEGSYTNYLFEKGIDKILKKVGEEASEVIIAAKNPDKEELVYEISDMVYHVLVLMAEKGIEIEDIKTELTKRF